MHTKRQKCRVFKLRKITFMLLFLGCLSLGIFYYYFYITLNRYILQALRIILSILPFLIMISIIEATLNDDDNDYLWCSEGFPWKDEIYVGAYGYDDPDIDHSTIDEVIVYMTWQADSWKDSRNLGSFAAL